MLEIAAVIIISEIMYNPASSEQAPIQSEWVELYNAGDQPVDLAGWYLQDEDGRTAPIPEDTTLAPDEALVLIPGSQNVEDFRAAWDGGEANSDDAYQIVPLDGWGAGGLRNLANSPSEENEILALRQPDERLADEVNYQNSDPWPSAAADGPSIYLLPAFLDAEANDDGAHWAVSEAGVDGAFHANDSSDYESADVGSPGVVVTADDTGDT